jgi:WD40 repeat protein
VSFSCLRLFLSLLTQLQLLPDEIALHVLSYLPWQSLLSCSAVNRRWRTLAEDTSLWKILCRARGIEWNQPFRHLNLSTLLSSMVLESPIDSDDEGMGDEIYTSSSEPGFGSRNTTDAAPTYSDSRSSYTSAWKRVTVGSNRHSAPSSLPASSSFLPNYKLLHQTHTRLYMRFLYSSYRLSTLQSRPGGPLNEQTTTSLHTSTIYCLQLYTNPQTGVQTLFTGSKDKSIREWDLQTSQFIRVVHHVHIGSVLSLAAHNGLLCSAGSDSRVCLWDLVGNSPLYIIHDHADSVLAVRLDEKRIVSCSKGTLIGEEVVISALMAIL